MKSKITLSSFALSALFTLTSGDLALANEGAPSSAAEKVQTPAEQVAGIQKMCSDAGPMIQKRQSEKPLYERLGKKPRIKVMSEKIFAAHSRNEKIGRLFKNVKKGPFVQNVTAFLVSGTGGKAQYQGKDMGTVHRTLNISNADFLAAGADVQGVMKEMKYGENEIQEIVCALTSFVPIVVTRQ